MDKNLPERVRPRKWSDVVGQDNVVKLLKQQVITQKGLSNAYILSGPSGVGKTTLARLFFMALNCENPKDGVPCQECPACKNVKFSLMEINASDKRGIEDMREVAKEMQYLGFNGAYKGILLDECHMLTKPAWNTLLKPMEDESQHGVWILCTTEIGKIPKTIKTRCQTYKLNPIRWTDIKTRLEVVAKSEKIDIKTDDLWTIAKNSDNNIRQALHLLEKYSVMGDLDKILASGMNLNFLEALRDSKIADLWKIFSSWSDEFEDISQFLNMLKYDLSVCLKIKLGISLGQISPYRKKKYEEITQYLTEGKLIKTLEIMLELQEKISGVFDYNSLFLKALIQMKK